jgi:hypothetical protein
MPTKSKSQFRYFQGIAHGSIKNSGLTPSQAQEWLNKNKGAKSYANLPNISRMMKNKKGS